jgi:predicted transcriptional regulator
MWDVHHEISRLVLLGLKNTEIAEKLGISEAMVSYTRNSQVVKDKMELMQGKRDADTIDIIEAIKEKAPKALKLLEQIMDREVGTPGELASIALSARTAESWLNRAGYPEQKPGINMHLHGHFTAQDIEEIKKRATESGQVIDI